MERRTLGKTGIETAVIGMGTWRTFDVPPGNAAAVEERAAIVTEAIGCGTDLFDSSPMYGAAEEVLAKAIGKRREDVLIATKVWSRYIDEGVQQIERALRYYGGCVDIYQVHNLVEWQAYLEILRRRQESGEVRAIGVTHYAHSAFPEIMRLMERGMVEVIQIPYNAADDRAAREVLPLAHETHTGVIVMSPLGTGDLTTTAPPTQELAALQSFGIRTWAQALLKWVISDPRVTVTIPATSRRERARENAEAGESPLLPEEERERVAWLARRLVR